MSTPLSLPGNVPPGAMLAALQAGAGAGQAMPAALQPEHGQYPHDPLEAVQTCINDLHGAMVALKDPQDTQDIAQALLVLQRIQNRLMGPKGGQGGAQPAR